MVHILCALLQFLSQKFGLVLAFLGNSLCPLPIIIPNKSLRYFLYFNAHAKYLQQISMVMDKL